MKQQMTFAQWFEARGFSTLEECATYLGVAISTVSRMQRPNYRASKFVIEHVRKKTGGRVVLAETTRNMVRA